MIGLMSNDRSITIRAAAEPDAGRIADLMTQLGYPATAQDLSQRLGYWLPDPMSRVLLAEHDGQVVGCLSAHAVPYLERTGRWLRIESLVVDERARGSGAGRALVAAAEGLARHWGCIAVEVTSARHRADAHAFYFALGFADACDRSARFFKLLPYM